MVEDCHLTQPALKLLIVFPWVRACAKVFRNKFVGAGARGPNEKKFKLFSGRSPTGQVIQKSLNLMLDIKEKTKHIGNMSNYDI